MRSASSPKCCHCREHFVPSPNNRGKQRYCSKPRCRKASKAAAQTKWVDKAENRHYFRGAENVERVRQWRRRHPGYWRKKRAAGEAISALQDLASIEAVQPETVRVQEQVLPAQKELVLQDLASCQVPLLAGVVSILIGEALQDRFAIFAGNS